MITEATRNWDKAMEKAKQFFNVKTDFEAFFHMINSIPSIPFTEVSSLIEFNGNFQSITSNQPILLYPGSPCDLGGAPCIAVNKKIFLQFPDGHGLTLFDYIITLISIYYLLDLEYPILGKHLFYVIEYEILKLNKGKIKTNLYKKLKECFSKFI